MRRCQTPRTSHWTQKTSNIQLDPQVQHSSTRLLWCALQMCDEEPPTALLFTLMVWAAQIRGRFSFPDHWILTYIGPTLYPKNQSFPRKSQYNGVCTPFLEAKAHVYNYLRRFSFSFSFLFPSSSSASSVLLLLLLLLTPSFPTCTPFTAWASL